ncbi:hypothetical protein LZF95_08105 [Algoriphagus sp. AGSA1]|uniref:hypothetical protein n=1 Tax=Algoriphagus sp. AGSA1 TaxID=2907213 RepID=UPI001F35AACE|nr:hypothetical protein [Algoriphagus sp. AGSA1]MCE7054634.1 hypothetical protein [Algoriphagus sp. AGSA1]
MLNKSDIIKSHTPFFTMHGFDSNPCGSVFEKAFEGGRQVVEVQCREESDGVVVEYYFGIRIHSVEELVSQYLPTLITNVEESLTLYMSLDKLGNSRLGKIKISTTEELTELQSAIENFFSINGFSRLDQMSNPLNLEQDFFYQQSKPSNSNEMVEVAFRSIALSKLFNPEDYPVLRQAYLEKMDYSEMTPLTVASFFHFLNFLDHLKPIAA